MKLKKIASLMLAGIMAVSMLAGCKSGDKNDPENNGNPGTSVSNTTTALYNELSEDAQKNISGVEDTALNNALKGSVDKYFSSANYNDGVNRVLRNTTNAVYAGLLDALDCTNTDKSTVGDNVNDDVTVVQLYAFDGSVSDAYILEQIADELSDWIELYPEHSSTAGYIDYTYTISASTATANATKPNGDTVSVKYVAVVINQTVSV